MTSMNKPALLELVEWLKDGAPHVVFSMDEARQTIENVLTWADDEEYNNIVLQRDQKGLGDCGTVCCIAGYVVEQCASEEQKEEIDNNWYDVRDFALEALGLDPDSPTLVDAAMGHNLFDNELAPRNCTPQQAADAVLRVLDGKEPWPLKD